MGSGRSCAGAGAEQEQGPGQAGVGTAQLQHPRRLGGHPWGDAGEAVPTPGKTTGSACCPREVPCVPRETPFSTPRTNPAGSPSVCAFSWVRRRAGGTGEGRKAAHLCRKEPACPANPCKPPAAPAQGRKARGGCPTAGLGRLGAAVRVPWRQQPGPLRSCGGTRPLPHPSF